MRKDIEWLKEEVWKQDIVMDKGYIYTDDLMSIINEVDEAEVLTPDWIDKHNNGPSRSQYVWVHDLKELLVPKQEEVDRAYKDGYEKGKEHATKVIKPTIPQFVADYIQEGKDLGCDLGTAMTVQTEVLKDIRNYIKNNEELFARAWLYGYTIKKEDKYYARIKGWENVTTGSEAFNWVYFKEKDTVGISKAVENKYQAVSFTKYDWNSLGINEYNADFFKS